MGKKGFGSKRRTVLQLDDGPRKQATFGLGYKASDSAPVADGSANALSGLMSHYAQDSGSDSDSNNEDSPTSASSFDLTGATATHQSKSSQGHIPFQKFVAATDASRSSSADQSDSLEHPQAAKEAKPVAPEVTKAPSDDIDIKLLDFLAEIESIEVKKEQTMDDGIDGVPISTESVPGQQSSSVEEHVRVSLATTSGNAPKVAVSDDEDDFKLSKPREPSSKWQQCLDEETQCYYYWHVDSNEVTWEIPPEYSQYLLRFAEYERARAHYDTELTEWKIAHPNRKPKTSKKKHRRHAKKADDVCIPIVSYPPEEEEPEEHSRFQGPVCGPPLPLIGPSLPEVPLNAPLDKGSESSMVNSCNGLELKGINAHESHSVLSSSVSAVSSTTELVAAPSRSLTSSVAVDAKSSGTKKLTSSLPPGAQDEVSEATKLKAAHAKFVKRAAKSKDQVGSSSSESKSSQKAQNDGGHTVSNIVVDAKVPEITSAETPAAPVGGIVDDYDEDDTFAQQMLEEPVFVKYEFVNKKYDDTENSQVNSAEQLSETDMEVEIDPDDIDQELERALEQRTHGSATELSLEHSVMPADYEGVGLKRKVREEGSDYVPVKKCKTNLEEPPSSLMMSLSMQEDVKRRVDELAEVAELASTITDKLSFLEVSCANLSKLQILMLQMETRIEDWRAGALTADRLLAKLRESCATLRQYELSATPLGWSCHWHRSYRRYYYRHEVTGDVCWDFPDMEVAPAEETSAYSENLEVTDSFPPEASVSLEFDRCEMPTEEVPPTSIDVIPSTELLAPYSVPSSVTLFPILDSSASHYLDEPPPPGTEPVLPRGLPTDLLSSLAACPPPPPPAPPQPSDIVLEDGSVALDDQEDIGSTFLLTDAGLPPDEEDPIGTYTNDNVITGLPVLNKPSVAEVTSSTSNINTPVMSPAAEGDIEGLGSPSVDERLESGSYDGIPTGDAISSGANSSNQGKERKKKKEKALVAGGLTLKKKNVSSLVEKWQKVQQDVTDEISKEELKLKMKKQQATSNNGAATGQE